MEVVERSIKLVSVNLDKRENTEEKVELWAEVEEAIILSTS